MARSYLSRDWPHSVVLIVILLVAAILLLGWPGLAEFKLDEATVSRQALALVRQGIWPPPSDTDIPGLPQPSGKAVLLTIPYAFTRNPGAAVLFQGLLGVIAVWLTYRFGSRYFDARVGLFAAGLFATTPWAIFFTRKLWQQNVPFFTIIMMFGLWDFVIGHKHNRILLAFLMLGVLASLYLGNLMLLLVIVLAVATNPRCFWPEGEGHDRWKPLIWVGAGVVSILVILSPYLYAVATGRVEIGKTMQLAATSVGRKFHLVEQVNMAAVMGTGDQFHSLAGDRFTDYIDGLPTSGHLGVLDMLAVWVIVAGMVYVVAKAGILLLRRLEQPTDGSSRRQAYGLLAIWVIVPIGLWTLSGLTPYLHRYNMLYPTQALVTAVLLVDGYDWLQAQPRRVWASTFRIVAGFWLVALISWHVIIYLAMLGFVSDHVIAGGYGRPVRELWAAAQRARELAGPESLPLVVHTDGANPDHQGGAAQFDAVLGDFHLYLLGDPRLEVAPAGKYVWVADYGDGSYTVEQRTSSAPSEAPGMARMANGVDLLYVDAEQPAAGKPMSITLTWRIWNSAPGRPDYGYSVQLHGTDDQRWAQVDGQFVRTVYWRPGDEVTVSISLPVDASAPAGGGYLLLVAMYAYLPDSVQGVDILDIAGNPSGQSVAIPLD
jgi:hypothetical protein